MAILANLLHLPLLWYCIFMTTAAPHTAVPSLLWPPNHDRATHSQGLSTQSATDLGLSILVRALDYDGRHNNFVRGVLQALVADPDVLRYRQTVLAELAHNEPLRAALAALVPQLAELAQPRSAGWTQESPLTQIPPRLSDLELYVSCIETLHAALNPDLQSPGLQHVREYVGALHASDTFQALAQELPTLRDQLDRARSVTIGLNLDRDLRPAAGTLVAINTEPFVGERSLAGRLLGRGQNEGIQASKPLRDLVFGSSDTSPLARDVYHALRDVVEPVGEALERYQRVQARPLAALAPEIAFYLGAIEMQRRLHAQGLPTCLPIVTRDEHALKEAYNPILALQVAGPSNNGSTPLAPNPISFDAGRVIVLTGPNRGGKTTYLRAVALNQVLFQAGVFVIATSARMSPVDAILTHFPPPESTDPGGGRLDDEARRVRDMFEHGTGRSLLFFNEPLTSTAEREALVLATDVIRALQMLNARTIFVTHLHALAEQIPAFNENGGATVVSWVADVSGDTPTYTIRPGTPQSQSHARRIAQQHGITFDQLKSKISELKINS